MNRLTYKDIFRRTLSSVEHPENQPIYRITMDGPYFWAHPDKYGGLILTENEMVEFNLLNDSTEYKDWAWIDALLTNAKLVTDFEPHKLLLAGKRRKLWYNRTEGTPEMLDIFPMENRFMIRYKCTDSLVYQSTEKPYGYFFSTPECHIYAFALPARALTENAHDWRMKND